MRDEYDFSPEELRKGVRGRFAERYKEGVKLIPTNNQPFAAGEAEPSVAGQPDVDADAPADLAAEHDH